MQAIDLTQALPDNLLVKADRMLMAWALEPTIQLCVKLSEGTVAVKTAPLAGSTIVNVVVALQPFVSLVTL